MSRLKENSKKVNINSWIANAKKEICKCCRKELGLFVGNIALFRGKCHVCRQKICSACVVGNLCHKCRVQRYVKLTPAYLMQLSAKNLTEIATKLHFHNPQGYEKSELVQLILIIYGMNWTRPIPGQPSSTNQPVDESQTCRLCDRELSACDPSDILCAGCAATRGGSYEPDGLMQMSAKDLQDILASLRVPEREVNGREKGELVLLILKTIGRHRDWRPQVPEQPSTRPRSFDLDNPVDIVISQQRNSPSFNPVPSLVSIEPDVSSVSAITQNPDTLIDWGTVAADLSTSAGAQSSDQNADFAEHEETERQQLSRVSSLRDIPSVEVIQDLKINQLKSLLQKHSVNIEGCCEKKDLADQVTLLYVNRLHAGADNDHDQQAPNSSNQRQPDQLPETSHQGESSSAPVSGNDLGRKGVSDSKSNIVLPEEIPCLRDIPSIEAIGRLSNRQLKTILHKHKVEYTKCRERGELLQRVTELWKDVTKWTSVDVIPDEDMCKICMDAPIDCVFLDCGHMATCTECGRQMPECPICRKFVVRVVHIFKSRQLPGFCSQEIINKLTNHQIQSILSTHGVDFSAFTEEEMAQYVMNLWHDERNNEAVNSNDPCGYANTCCVCKRSDQPTDCVFLNCGHAIMCMDCGSKTKECPKCGQYIFRVVRAFKS